MTDPPVTRGSEPSTGEPDADASQAESQARIAACTREIETGTRDSRDLSMAHVRRGDAYSALRDDERALRDYLDAMRIDPANARAFLGRAALFLRRDHDGWMEALKDYDEVIRLDPGNALAYLQRGRIVGAEIAGGGERAIADFDRALALEPNNAAIYFARGWAWERAQQRERAIEDYGHAIRLNPTSDEAHESRARLHALLGHHDRALHDHDQMVRLKPDDGGAYLLRANCYASLGQLARALADYDEASRLHPEYAEVYLGRARVHDARGSREAAIADYGEAIRLRCFGEHEAHAARGYGLAVLGRTEEALADFRQSLELRPGNPDALAHRAYAYVRIGRYAEAVHDCDAVIATERAPSRATVRFIRAIARAALGDRAAAEADLLAAHALDPHIDETAASIQLRAPRFD